MPMQRYKPEQIVTVLRQIEVVVANGRIEGRRFGVTAEILNSGVELKFRRRLNLLHKLSGILKSCQLHCSNKPQFYKYLRNTRTISPTSPSHNQLYLFD